MTVTNELIDSLLADYKTPENLIGEIAQRIHLIRGQRVVLDTDLAAFTVRQPSGLTSRSTAI